MAFCKHANAVRALVRAVRLETLPLLAALKRSSIMSSLRTRVIIDARARDVSVEPNYRSVELICGNDAHEAIKEVDTLLCSLMRTLNSR